MSKKLLQEETLQKKNSITEVIIHWPSDCQAIYRVTQKMEDPRSKGKKNRYVKTGVKISETGNISEFFSRVQDLVGMNEM